MTVQESVKKLISLVEQHKFLEAIQEFYADDASMQENNASPRCGLAALLENERKVMASFKELHVARAQSFIAGEDHAAIRWLFEYTDVKGRRLCLDEVAYQHWRDGKIVSERFFYDPAGMLQPSETTGDTLATAAKGL